MRLALYAHYGKEGRIASYVLYCLRALRAAGFEIIFLSNSTVTGVDRERVEELCRQLVERENEGYDFGMWQQGIGEVDLQAVDELLLVNSSIVGPLTELSQLWTRPETTTHDFWGLTDNEDLAPHLQSYFMVFNKQVIRSACFSRFWDTILLFEDKMQVIRSYEVGLTSWLQQHGFSWCPLFPSRDVWATYKSEDPFVAKIRRRVLRTGGRGPNTTLSCPEILLRKGMPFLKASLLEQDNPYIEPSEAFRLLARTALPRDILDDLRKSSGS